MTGAGRDRCFVAIVHDVAPAFERQLEVILAQLAPLLGGKLAAAVVPLGAGRRWADAPGLRAAVRDATGEVLAHGLTHRRAAPGGLVSWLTDRSDELGDLPPAELAPRLALARRLTGDLFERAVRGFVPPAWQLPRGAAPALAAAGFDYRAGLHALVPARGARRRLATWSWDWGRSRHFGHLAAPCGRLLALRGGATPCVVVHPLDVDRGWFAAALARIRGLLRGGHRPVGFAEMLGAPTGAGRCGG